MREEDNNKQMPLVIDVDPNELIAVENEKEELDDMPTEFELREPDTQGEQTVYEKANSSDVNTKKVKNLNNEKIDHIDTLVTLETQEKTNTENKTFYQEVKEEYKEEKKVNQGGHSSDKEKATGKEKKKDDKETRKQDTSFNAFKKKQYESERKWRQKAGNSMKDFVGKLLFIFIGIPFLIAAAAASIFAGGFGVFFGVMFLGFGILGLGVAGFLTTSQAGAIAAVAGYGSFLLIGLSSLALLILWRVLVWIKDVLVATYKKVRR